MLLIWFFSTRGDSLSCPSQPAPLATPNISFIEATQSILGDDTCKAQPTDIDWAPHICPVLFDDLKSIQGFYETNINTLKNVLACLFLYELFRANQFKVFPKNSIISDSYSSNNINYNEQFLPNKRILLKGWIWNYQEEAPYTIYISQVDYIESNFV